MISVDQFKGMNMLEHGLSVRKHFKQIKEDLDAENYSRYDFPEKLISNWDAIKNHLHSEKVNSVYQIFHDCGKPFCEERREDGSKFFPNHAEKSFEVFVENFDIRSTKGRDKIAHLIRNDMIYHSGSAEEINAFIARETPQVIWTLYVTSLAEIFANKEMFDNDNQLSFKIKYKKLSKLLNKLTKQATDSRTFV